MELVGPSEGGVGCSVALSVYSNHPFVLNPRAQDGDRKGHSHLDLDFLLFLNHGSTVDVQFSGEQHELGFVGYFSCTLPPIPLPSVCPSFPLSPFPYYLMFPRGSPIPLKGVNPRAGVCM